MLFWSNIMQWVNHLLVLHKFRSRIAWFERDRWSFVLYSCGGYHGNAQRLFAVQTRSARGTPALQALRWDVPSGPGYMISTDTDTNTLARSGAQCNEMLVISCCGVVCLMSPAVKKRKEKNWDDVQLSSSLREIWTSVAPCCAEYTRAGWWCWLQMFACLLSEQRAC